MTLVAVTGDCATTTSLALAACWTGEEAIVVEADPSGGSLAGWLDTPASPSLATIVANVGRREHDVPTTLLSLTHSSNSGIRFVACPSKALAAHRAVAEAAAVVLPALGRADEVAIVDVGRHRVIEPSAAVALASTVVLVHRQNAASAGAEAVELERLVESVEQLATAPGALVLALIGDAPFDPADISTFVDDAAPGAVDRVVVIAEDPLSAAVFAGRRGVSARRLLRLPLLRTAARAADVVRELTVDSAVVTT